MLIAKYEERGYSAFSSRLNKFQMDLAKKQIELAFGQAQKEVDDLHQRTSEGIETARLNGKQIGGVPGKKLTTKKSVEKKAEIRKHSIDFGGTLNDIDCIIMNKIHVFMHEYTQIFTKN